MHVNERKRRNGFSLIELVIVVVIIGIIGAIAIPRMSRGASGAADSALVANLSVLRNAIDLYQAEHGGAFPDLADIREQLTQFTDPQGNTSPTKTAPFIYGPYLRAIPSLPVGPQQGQTGFIASQDPTEPAGWVYNESTGDVRANTGTLRDDANTLYSEY